MRACNFLIACAVGCGRIGFDSVVGGDAGDAGHVGDGGTGAIAFVQMTPEGGALGSASTSFSAPSQLGDTIVAATVSVSSAAVTWPAAGVSDDAGNQYALASTAAAASVGGGFMAVAVYYARVTGASPATTVTAVPASTGSEGSTIVAMEYMGIAGGDPVDATAGSGGDSPTASTGATMTTRFANELAVAVFVFNCVGSGSTTCTLSSPSGYTVRVSENLATAIDEQVDDRVLGAPGAEDVSWTTGGSGNSPPNYVACVATFAPR
jgi:hypothetical protein